MTSGSAMTVIRLGAHASLPVSHALARQSNGTGAVTRQSDAPDRSVSPDERRRVRGASMAIIAQRRATDELVAIHAVRSSRFHKIAVSSERPRQHGGMGGGAHTHSWVWRAPQPRSVGLLVFLISIRLVLAVNLFYLVRLVDFLRFLDLVFLDCLLYFLVLVIFGLVFLLVTPVGLQ